MPVNIICEWRFLGDLGGANWECAISLITSKKNSFIHINLIKTKLFYNYLAVVTQNELMM